MKLIDEVLEIISRETKLESNFGGGIRVPKLKLGKFLFTGTTEFQVMIWI